MKKVYIAILNTYADKKLEKYTGSQAARIYAENEDSAIDITEKVCEKLTATGDSFYNCAYIALYSDMQVYTETVN